MIYNKDRSLYDWCINTLVNAYFSDTLRAGEPCGCAVGNLITQRLQDNRDYDLLPYAKIWNFAFSTGKKILFVFESERSYFRSSEEYYQVVYDNSKSKKGWEVIDKLQLPRKVVMDIEWEFETKQIGDSDDEKMFNGLLVVIKVLDKYFGIDEFEVNKAKFVKPIKSVKQLII